MASTEEFGPSLLRGLNAVPKFAEPKWLYDERGSALFDQICETEDYYPTRSETAILKARSGEIAECLGGGMILVEPGAGSAVKVRLLLDRLERIESYVPQDISGEHLAANAAALNEDYPDLAVIPVIGDFTQGVALPPDLGTGPPVTIFFPGSTIGNFEPAKAEALLARFASVRNVQYLVLGADLRKDEAVLLRAYDDGEGVTAAFNLNLLVRANTELNADFDLDAFAHRVRYDRDVHRIEMHLESLRDQQVRLSGQTVHFTKGETIHTENSYKYDQDSLVALAGPAGWDLLTRWYDPDRLFGVFLFEIR